MPYIPETPVRHDVAVELAIIKNFIGSFIDPGDDDI